MDNLLQGLHDGIAEGDVPAPEDAMESSGGGVKLSLTDQILQMIETMNMSEADRADIRANLMNPERMAALMGGGGAGAPVPRQDPFWQYTYLLLGVFTLLSIFGKKKLLLFQN